MTDNIEIGTINSLAEWCAGIELLYLELRPPQREALRRMHRNDKMPLRVQDYNVEITPARSIKWPAHDHRVMRLKPDERGELRRKLEAAARLRFTRAVNREIAKRP